MILCAMECLALPVKYAPSVSRRKLLNVLFQSKSTSLCDVIESLKETPTKFSQPDRSTTVSLWQRRNKAVTPESVTAELLSSISSRLRIDSAI